MSIYDRFRKTLGIHMVSEDGQQPHGFLRVLLILICCPKRISRICIIYQVNVHLEFRFGGRKVLRDFRKRSWPESLCVSSHYKTYWTSQYNNIWRCLICFHMKKMALDRPWQFSLWKIRFGAIIVCFVFNI